MEEMLGGCEVGVFTTKAWCTLAAVAEAEAEVATTFD